jgi:GAF domain-containing protein/HAMP domain-containing protein
MLEWTIGRRLAVTYLFAGVLILGSIGILYAGLAGVEQNLEKTTGDVLEEHNLESDLRSLSHEFLSETREYVQFGEAETLEELQEVEQGIEAALASFAAAGEELEAAQEAEAERIDRLTSAWAGLRTASQEMIALHDQRAGREKLAEAGERLEQSEVAIELVLEEMTAALDEGTAAVQASSQAAMKNNRLLLLILPVLLLPLAAFMYDWLRRSIVLPIHRVEEAALRIAAGEMEQDISVTSHDEIGMLARSFNTMTGRLRNTIQAMEQRSGALARSVVYLETTAHVAQDAASVLDMEKLLSRTTQLISERFGFYHTGIFLLDAEGEYAVLHAASSPGGQRMLARGHRLRVAQEGVVGHATGHGEPRIALDVGDDTAYFDNPDLPETRSEMALPLRARGEIIGALDIQSTEPQAFSQEDAAVLQTLADHIALAISNARLLQQAQSSLEAERQAYGELSRQAWLDLLRTEANLGYVSDKRGTAKDDGRLDLEMKKALQTGEIAQGNGQRSPAVAIPIKVRGQVVGVVDAHKSRDAGAWTSEELSLMEALTSQLSVALESARLYHDTQRRAARERLIGEVTARIRETLSVEKVLQTAADEMFHALGFDEVVIRLAAGTKSDEATPQ